jgi:WD40 repeat protein
MAASLLKVSSRGLPSCTIHGSVDKSAACWLLMQHTAVLSVLQCRVEFTPDSSCIWALCCMPQPADTDSDAPPSAKQPDTAAANRSSSSLLCFSVAEGTLLQVLQRPHGSAPVASFCLSPDGSVMVTCGTDHLVKLWDVGAGTAAAAAAAAGVVLDRPSVGQSFTAHHGAVNGG